MLIHHFFTPELSINSYLVYDETKKCGALIDPTRKIDVYLDFARLKGICITDIFETHVHADFISGAPELKKALNNKPTIHCSGMGGEKWTPAYADHVMKDGEEVIIGFFHLKALHTPGHTFEHMVLLLFDDSREVSTFKGAFTGDLLFVGSVGRPDLLGPVAEMELQTLLYQSLSRLVEELPDFVEIYPSHGAGSLCGKEIAKRAFSTMGEEKRTNPGLALQNYDRWLKALWEGMSPAPKYFETVKRKNLAEIKLPKEKPYLVPIDQIRHELPLHVVVDIRNPEAFACQGFKGSINIPFTPSFTSWAGSVLTYDTPLMLVADTKKEVEAAVQALRLIGLDNVVSFTALAEWKESERFGLLRMIPMIDVQDLFRNQKLYYILDVRSSKEWNEAHIVGAHQIALTKIADVISEVPTDRPIAVICHSGNRASIAASLIFRERGITAFNVRGGMKSWINDKLPVVTL